MPKISLLVNGKEYDGWERARVTRGIESVAGTFDLEVSDRWAGHDVAWTIREEDVCSVKVDGKTVLTGYVDRRSLSYSSDAHTLSVSGRDKTGDLVDCSAVLDKWEFLGLSVLAIAKRIAEPLGIKVSMSADLEAKLGPPPARVAVDPGETAFAVIEKLCRLTGLLPVSDGKGGLILTRAGRSRATTSLVEGENIKAASAEYDASNRFRRYIVSAQHAGTEEFFSDQAAGIRAEASDPNVQRASRVILIRPEGNATPETAKTRALWEASIRAARAGTVHIDVQGWQQKDGTLWPVNALVAVKSPLLRLKGEMLISQAAYSIDENGGTVTQLTLRRPDAFVPEPLITKDPWPEIRTGAR